MWSIPDRFVASSSSLRIRTSPGWVAAAALIAVVLLSACAGGQGEPEFAATTDYIEYARSELIDAGSFGFSVQAVRENDLIRVGDRNREPIVTGAVAGEQLHLDFAFDELLSTFGASEEPKFPATLIVEPDWMYLRIENAPIDRWQQIKSLDGLGQAVTSGTGAPDPRRVWHRCPGS